MYTYFLRNFLINVILIPIDMDPCHNLPAITSGYFILTANNVFGDARASLVCNLPYIIMLSSEYTCSGGSNWSGNGTCGKFGLVFEAVLKVFLCQ